MRHFQHLAILVAVLLTQVFASAQTPPQAKTPPTAPTKSPPQAKIQPKVPAPSKEYVGSTTSIDDAGKKQIKEFINSRMIEIETGSAKNVRQATNDILEVLRLPIATPIFLRVVFDELKPFATTMFAVKEPAKENLPGKDKVSPSLRASNFFEILRWTRTPGSLDILINQATMSVQHDMTTRIGASRLLADCASSSNMTAPQIDTAARHIREAAEMETSWIVRAHEMQALVAMIVVAQTGKMQPQAEFVRNEFLKVLAIIAGNTSKEKDSEQVLALQRGLILLRDMLLKTPQDEKIKMTSAIKVITQSTIVLAKQPPKGDSATETALRKSATGAAQVAISINTLLGDKPSAQPAKTPA